MSGEWFKCGFHTEQQHKSTKQTFGNTQLIKDFTRAVIIDHYRKIGVETECPDADFPDQLSLTDASPVGTVTNRSVSFDPITHKTVWNMEMVGWAESWVPGTQRIIRT